MSQNSAIKILLSAVYYVPYSLPPLFGIVVLAQGASVGSLYSRVSKLYHLGAWSSYEAVLLHTSLSRDSRPGRPSWPCPLLISQSRRP